MPAMTPQPSSPTASGRAAGFDLGALARRHERPVGEGADAEGGDDEVLVSLSEAPDRTLRMSELAERSRSSRSRMSHAVARLEQAGLIERRGCPSDKRGAFAVLTEKGYSALSDAAPGHVNAVREVLFDTLTPNQIQQLGEICSAIVDGRSTDPNSGDPLGASCVRLIHQGRYAAGASITATGRAQRNRQCSTSSPAPPSPA